MPHHNTDARAEPAREPLVRYRSQTPAQACPYGQVERIITGGDGGVANVHVVTVTQGTVHAHAGYDEVYYALNGEGTVIIDQQEHRVEPGAVVVIPAGTPHSLQADSGHRLEFVIFGTPPMPLTDERARPQHPE